jgi:membrane protease YdiL (CAAX protease family)
VTDPHPVPAHPPPPPDPPEFPEDAPPRWPAWYAPVSFVTAFAVLLVAVVPIYALAGSDATDDPPAWMVIAATLVQSVVFTGVALLFASMAQRPRAWHFGLRRTRFWPAVGWAALGLLAFYVFAAVYAALVQPDVEQTVTEDLGADEGTLGLILAGVMVIVVAPAAEEFFFRGFFYRALRSRLGMSTAAAIDGVVFGLLHFEGEDAALILPPLAVLGFLFCLVYERTGSLYPVIALHAFNNSVAYGAQAEAWVVSAVLGPLMIGACALVPRLAAPGAEPAPALR